MFIKKIPLAILWLLLAAATGSAGTISIIGSGTSTAPVVAAVPKLKELGIEIRIDPTRNTAIAVLALGQGIVELGIATRPLTGDERAAYPKLRMIATPFAYQTLAFAVSEDVWASGVRALSREQARDIYEAKITNWKQLGGADRPLKFLNPAEGRGVWELFATWLYEDPAQAPTGAEFKAVETFDAAQEQAAGTLGAITLLSPQRIDGKALHALAILNAEGKPVEATLDTSRDGSYPLARSFDFISADRPSGEIKTVIDFMLGPAGAELIRQADLVPIGKAAP